MLILLYLIGLLIWILSFSVYLASRDMEVNNKIHTLIIIGLIGGMIINISSFYMGG